MGTGRHALLGALFAVGAAVGCSGGEEPAKGSVAPTTRPALPERDPEVTGIAVYEGNESMLRLGEPSDESLLWIPLGRDAMATSADGEVVSVDLAEGDHVRVWIDGGCGESFPAACDIVAIEVVMPSDP